MKKTSKLFGAIALSATLAMGCALPAFAAETAGATDDIEASEDDTTINKVEGEELIALIDAVLADTGAATKKDMGRVMGELTKRTGGNFDKAAAAQQLGSRLS